MKNFLRFCAVMLAVAACSFPPPSFEDMTRTTNTGGLIPEDAVRAVALSDGPVYGKAVVRHMPRLAGVAGGLPIVVPPGRPIAGGPFTLAWTTRPSAPFPDVPVALFVSFREPGGAHPIPHARGGMLQVPPDMVFKPGEVSWLTQSGGTVRADLTFSGPHVGTSLWCQLVVKHPVAGVLTSPVVALTVGNR